MRILNSYRYFGLIASVSVSMLYLLLGLQLIDSTSILGYMLQLGNLNFNFSLSNTGLLLLVLTVLIWPAAILASWSNLLHSYGTYLALLFSLELVLIYLFLTDNLIVFYILFELSLLPLYLLIGQFGASTQRLRASRLLWTYTFLGSLCLLVSIVWLLAMFGTTNFSSLNLILTQSCALSGSESLLSSLSWFDKDNNTLNIVWILIALGIANKVPTVPLHIWLPKAHVQANVSTSIILAAIILKLSTYASLILLINLMPNAAAYFSSTLLTVGLISYIHSSLATLSQIDSKVLAAYSSVAHMCLITIGIHSNNYLALVGAILLALAHASSSAALFTLFGQVLYDRLHNRLFYYMRNVAAFAPGLKIMLLVTMLANSGLPGTINWLSELSILTGTAYNNLFVAIILSTTIFTSALYSFWPYSFATAGIAITNKFNYLFDLTKLETSLLLYLLVPNFIFGINAWLLEPIVLKDVISLLY